MPAQSFHPNDAVDAHARIDPFLPIDPRGDRITDFAATGIDQTVGV
ncbi:MAG: hypothetical protein R3E53_00180 [Myxococcota bacterium]